MQEKSVTTGESGVTQRYNFHNAPWSKDELALLTGFAHRRAVYTELREAFPGRTLAAIRIRLSHLRASLGIRPLNCEDLLHRENSIAMLAPDDPGIPCAWPERWRKSAANANDRYLAAIQMAT